MLQLYPILGAVKHSLQLFLDRSGDEYANQIMIKVPHGFSIIIFLTL
jgi:hypothetical protein